MPDDFAQLADEFIAEMGATDSDLRARLAAVTAERDALREALKDAWVFGTFSPERDDKIEAILYPSASDPSAKEPDSA